MQNRSAFVFPGQGSQCVGMLANLAANFSMLEDTYKEASEVLGYDLWRLVQEGPEEQLNQTEYTQPALLAGEVALWRMYCAKNNIMPLFMAGHSLGEYSALVCAQSIKFQDAVKLVAKRGQLMQRAVPRDQGGMVAIVGLDDVKIDEVCKEAALNSVLAPANYNSIGQTVLSGNLVAAERAVDFAKALGAKVAKLLKVSVPAHCELMKPAALELTKYLNDIEIKSAVIPVINNVDVVCYRDADSIRDGLIRQLYSPVHWVKTIQFLHKQQLNYLVECGPGKVLAGLNKRIVNDLVTKNIEEML